MSRTGSTIRVRSDRRRRGLHKSGETFSAAMAMLTRSVCPTCMGLGWYLGFAGRMGCHGCLGRGWR